MAQRQRRHSSFQLDALVIVEINVIVDERSGFIKGGGKMSIDALCLNYGEEIFSHCIVIAISTS